MYLAQEHGGVRRLLQLSGTRRGRQPQFQRYTDTHLLVWCDFNVYVPTYIHTFHPVVSVDGSGYDGVALRQSRSNLGYNNATSGIMRGTNILFAGGDGDGIGDPYNRTTFSARSQVKVFFALLMVL